MKVNIIISFILLLIIYLSLKCKETFHPIIKKTNENKLDYPLHNFNNINYDNYMLIGDGIQANINNNVPNDLNKVNICNECKIQKCDGMDCLECDTYCRPFLENNITTISSYEPEQTGEIKEFEANYAKIPLKYIFN